MWTTHESEEIGVVGQPDALALAVRLQILHDLSPMLHELVAVIKLRQGIGTSEGRPNASARSPINP
jgi:hypothetical protein